MRVPASAGLCLLVACHAGPAVEAPRPDVPLAVAWPPGTRFRTEVADGLPDEPRWRALAVWWREALHQTVAFGLTEAADRTTPVLELTVAPDARALAAVLRTPDGERALAGESFADGELLAAIDRLAWATRIALGEDADAPRPVAAITSADPIVALAVDDAQRLLATGAFASAERTLRAARPRDGGAPFLLEGIAALDLLGGNARTAERVCREALGYEIRLSPTVRHRLARTLLQARASQDPPGAATFDRELLQLALVTRRERPHDDEPALSEALAHNFLGDFAAARRQLTELRVRLPERAVVAYHLGWACLADGAPHEAVEHLAEAALRMPGPWVLLPRAIALYEAGEHDQLEHVLAATLDEFSRSDDDVLVHQVQRMQAAHALLRGQQDAACDLLLADLRWLLRHPVALEARAGELAEEGAVLVRLGGASELPSLLTAVQRQHPATAVADACAFVGGMVEVSSRRDRLPELEAELSRGGESAWSARLKAFAHEQRGEVGDMQVELAHAAQLSASPMTKALLAHSLRAVGRAAEADELHAALRRELTTLHLRKPCQHPLYGPELAFAFALR